MASVNTLLKRRANKKELVRHPVPPIWFLPDYVLVFSKNFDKVWLNKKFIRKGLEGLSRTQREFALEYFFAK